MYKKLIVVIFLALALTQVTFAEEQGDDAVSSPETPAKIVTAIQVTGNKSISTNVIISKLKTRVGSAYQENIVSDDLKRLYLLGFFSDVKIDTQDYKEGIKIIITVAERPIIQKITFNGITRIVMKDEKLKEKLKSKESQYLDYPTLAEDVRILKGMYEKMGFSEADITYNVDVDKAANKANVQFNVSEGRKVRIKTIKIQGNKAFPSKRILGLLKTKPAWFFNAGVLKDEVVREDVDRIRTFYQKNGYTDVSVEYSVNPDPKKTYLLYVTFKIEEGKQYLVGNINIVGNSEIKQKEILAKLSECTPGKVFSQDAMRADIGNIQGLYFDRGFIMVQIQEDTSVDPTVGRVDITYNIVENQVAYVNKIRVRGNIKTKDVVVRREMRIYPGDKFDGEKLRRSKERLQNLGFFDEVSYDTEDSQVAADKKDLVVEVKEAKTGAFSFGGGYSTVDEFVGFVEIEQKNFDWTNWPYFTGAGQTLKFRGSMGSLTNDFTISFTNPWVFDYPYSFGFDLYRNTHKRDEHVGYGYDEEVTGGDLRLGKELTEYIKGELKYRNDEITIENVTGTASSALQQEIGSNKISSGQAGLTFDDRNNVFEPTKGNFINGTFELAGGPFLGDKNFYKFTGRASHYFPLVRNSALEVRGRIGYSEPYDTSNSIPIYERFFAGGAYTIRGYEERKVGPLDSVSNDPLGGNSMLIGNLEYTYPVFSFLRLAAFVDSGNVWSKAQDIGNGGFKTGVGLGFRVKTPLGPIMLDYGFPLNKIQNEEKKNEGRIHFSMSNGF
jgi:outer membrane protein insertion porin family